MSLNTVFVLCDNCRLLVKVDSPSKACSRNGSPCPFLKEMSMREPRKKKKSSMTQSLSCSRRQEDRRCGSPPLPVPPFGRHGASEAEPTGVPREPPVHTGVTRIEVQRETALVVRESGTSGEGPVFVAVGAVERLLVFHCAEPAHDVDHDSVPERCTRHPAESSRRTDLDGPPLKTNEAETHGKTSDVALRPTDGSRVRRDAVRTGDCRKCDSDGKNEREKRLNVFHKTSDWLWVESSILF